MSSFIRKAAFLCRLMKKPLKREDAKERVAFLGIYYEKVVL